MWRAVTGNTAHAGHGGAIFSKHSTAVTYLHSSTLSGNWAQYGGGAVWHDGLIFEMRDSVSPTVTALPPLAARSRTARAHPVPSALR